MQAPILIRLCIQRAHTIVFHTFGHALAMLSGPGSFTDNYSIDSGTKSKSMAMSEKLLLPCTNRQGAGLM